jgi:hypothetical protein
MANEKRYTVMVEVEADPKDAAKLRHLLPDFLHKAGFVVTTSTTPWKLAHGGWGEAAR